MNGTEDERIASENAVLNQAMLHELAGLWSYPQNEHDGRTSK